MNSMLPLNPYHSTLLFFSGSALLVMMFLVLIAGRLPAGFFTAAWWGVLSLIALAVRWIRRPKAPPRLPS